MLIGIPTIPTPQEHPAGFSILEAISRASARGIPFSVCNFAYSAP